VKKAIPLLEDDEISIESTSCKNIKQMDSLLSVVHCPLTNKMGVFGRDINGKKVHKIFEEGDPGCYVASYNFKDPYLPDCLRNVKFKFQPVFKPGDFEYMRFCEPLAGNRCPHGGHNDVIPAKLYNIQPDSSQANGIPYHVREEATFSRCVPTKKEDSTDMVFNSHLSPTTRFQLHNKIRFKIGNVAHIKTATIVSLGRELGFTKHDPFMYKSIYVYGFFWSN